MYSSTLVVEMHFYWGVAMERRRHAQSPSPPLNWILIVSMATISNSLFGTLFVRFQPLLGR